MIRAVAAPKSMTGRWPVQAQILLLLLFAVLTASCSLHDIAELLQLGCGGAVIWVVAGGQWRNLLKRFLPVLPLAVLMVGSWVYVGDYLAAAVLTLKIVWCLAGASLLADRLSIENFAEGLLKLRVPCLMVMVITLILRYCTVLEQEAANLRRSWSLRSGGRRATLKEWSALLGNLFLRSWSRAQRIAHAMQCRNYDLRSLALSTNNWRDPAWRQLLVLGIALCFLRFW